MIRVADLNLDVIKKAHADDVEAYKKTKASPQHVHRHWLIRRVEELEKANDIALKAHKERLQSRVHVLAKENRELQSHITELESVLKGKCPKCEEDMESNCYGQSTSCYSCEYVLQRLGGSDEGK